MLKLPLVLFALLGTCAAQNQPSLAQLQSNARVLIVFAPNANSAEYKRQLQMIERHSFELSVRNTVVVPVSTSPALGERFSIENLPLGSANEENAARTRFHVRPGDFLVVLIDLAGSEQIRSASPVDIRSLTASLDSLPVQH
jgi:hypothetical protein